MIGRDGQADGSHYLQNAFHQIETGRHMKQIIILAVLGLLTMAGAATEFFFQGLPQQVVQINGLLTIILALVFVTLTLRLQARGLQRTK